VFKVGDRVIRTELNNWWNGTYPNNHGEPMTIKFISPSGHDIGFEDANIKAASQFFRLADNKFSKYKERLINGYKSQECKG
jgi:hypothetical protein